MNSSQGRKSPTASCRWHLTRIGNLSNCSTKWIYWEPNIPISILPLSAQLKVDIISALNPKLMFLHIFHCKTFYKASYGREKKAVRWKWAKWQVIGWHGWYSLRNHLRASIWHAQQTFVHISQTRNLWMCFSIYSLLQPRVCTSTACMMKYSSKCNSNITCR